MTITADRFLSGVKRRISLAENDALLDDDDLLELADDITRAHIVPMLISTRGEFFVKSVDEATVANQAEYNLPDRAVGLALRNLKYRPDVDDTEIAYDLIEINPEHEDDHRGSAGQPWGYYFKNDQLVIVATPADAEAAIEIWHEQRPSNLVKLEEAGIVLSATATEVTLTAAVPDNIVLGTVVDFVKGKAGHRILAMDKTVTAVAGSVITFASGAIPSALVAGDYIAEAGFSPVLQIPDELHPLLETFVARRALFAAGDIEMRRELSDDEKGEMKNALILLEPRNRGAPRKIVNQGGLLKGRAGSRRRGGYYR